MKRYIVLPRFLYPLTACWDCHVNFSTLCKLFHEYIKVHTDNQKHVDNEQFLKWCFLKLGFLQTISKFLKVPFGSLLSFELFLLLTLLHWKLNSNIPNLFNKTFIIKLNVWYTWERVQRNSLQLPFSSWSVVQKKQGIEILAEYLHKSINVSCIF